ncbi:uncharacterized protein [Physcomitrium patens]|uniref:uncharacterized protein n=1 Tax=Physcomitrium patens TaxID=3218 RepID=UPI003CCD1DCC
MQIMAWSTFTCCQCMVSRAEEEIILMSTESFGAGIQTIDDLHDKEDDEAYRKEEYDTAEEELSDDVACPVHENRRDEA